MSWLTSVKWIWWICSIVNISGAPIGLCISPDFHIDIFVDVSRARTIAFMRPWLLLYDSCAIEAYVIGWRQNTTANSSLSSKLMLSHTTHVSQLRNFRLLYCLIRSDIFILSRLILCVILVWIGFLRLEDRNHIDLFLRLPVLIVSMLRHIIRVISKQLGCWIFLI